MSKVIGKWTTVRSRQHRDRLTTLHMTERQADTVWLLCNVIGSKETTDTDALCREKRVTYASGRSSRSKSELPGSSRDEGTWQRTGRDVTGQVQNTPNAKVK